MLSFSKQLHHVIIIANAADQKNIYINPVAICDKYVDVYPSVVFFCDWSQ